MSTAPRRPATDTPQWLRRLPWVAVLLWAAVIFAISARPGSTLPGGYSVQGHLGEYFILGALLFWALRGRRSESNAVAVALILASLYGITDEIHQHFVVLRTPDVADWALDTVGATLGALTACAVVRLRSSRRRSAPPDSDRFPAGGS